MIEKSEPAQLEVKIVKNIIVKSSNPDEPNECSNASKERLEESSNQVGNNLNKRQAKAASK